MSESVRGFHLAPWARRHAYMLVVTGMLSVFLGLFLLAEWLRVPLLSDASAGYLDSRSWMVAMFGLALLVLDVLLPVPASGVMISMGSVFGVMVGSALSLAGGVAATTAAYMLGGRSRPMFERLVSPEQMERAAGLLDRHGVWAIVATRPLPMVAETVAILAGTSRLSLRSVVLAGALGNLVPAVAYASVGAYSATFVNGVFVFTGVLMLGGAVWVAQRVASNVSARPAEQKGEGDR